MLSMAIILTTIDSLFYGSLIVKVGRLYVNDFPLFLPETLWIILSNLHRLTLIVKENILLSTKQNMITHNVSFSLCFCLMKICMFLIQGNVTMTPLNNLLYNISPANLKLHGHHPHWLHVVVNMSLLFGPLYITTLFAILKLCRESKVNCFRTSITFSSSSSSSLHCKLFKRVFGL
jgi:hypothetical protein